MFAVAAKRASLSIYPSDDAIRIVTEKAGACGGCGGMFFIFINRAGRTLCAHCDLTKENPPHATT